MVRLAFLIFSSIICLHAQLYVAPNGLDTNPGTISQPLLTLTKAMSLVGADATIYLRGGDKSSPVGTTI